MSGGRCGAASGGCGAASGGCGAASCVVGSCSAANGDSCRGDDEVVGGVGGGVVVFTGVDSGLGSVVLFLLLVAGRVFSCTGGGP